MSRVFRPESGSRLRARWLRDLGLACEACRRPPPSTEEARDLLAFLALSLREIARSSEQTAAAWEKRGYWIKADRFRRDWSWPESVLRSLDAALKVDDLARAMQIATSDLAPHLGASQPARRGRSPAPWVGSWSKWEQLWREAPGPLGG